MSNPKEIVKHLEKYDGFDDREGLKVSGACLWEEVEDWFVVYTLIIYGHFEMRQVYSAATRKFMRKKLLTRDISTIKFMYVFLFKELCAVIEILHLFRRGIPIRTLLK